MITLEITFSGLLPNEYNLRYTPISIEIKESINKVGVYLADVSEEDFISIAEGKKGSVFHNEFQKQKNLLIRNEEEFIVITAIDSTQERIHIKIPRLIWISFYNLLMIAKEQ